MSDNTIHKNRINNSQLNSGSYLLVKHFDRGEYKNKFLKINDFLNNLQTANVDLDVFNDIISNIDNTTTADIVTFASVAPSFPTTYAFWVDTDTLNMYMKYDDSDSTQWVLVGPLAAGASIPSEVNDLSASVVWVNVPDANITESSVTQHQAALTITESQISDLSYVNDKHFTFNQISPAVTWNINHGLNKFPSVEVVTTGGDIVEGDINHVDANNVTLTFSAAFAGRAYIN